MQVRQAGVCGLSSGAVLGDVGRGRATCSTCARGVARAEVWTEAADRAAGTAGAGDAALVGDVGGDEPLGARASVPVVHPGPGV